MFVGIEFHRASTDDWVDISLVSDWADNDGLRLLNLRETGLQYLTLMYADFKQPAQSWNQNRLNRLLARANELFQKRVPLASLPVDDPDRLTDPANPPWRYWDAGDLVECENQITKVVYDGRYPVITQERRPTSGI